MSGSGELRPSQQCLQPLEFEDCLTDSPAFRENLKSHEKEIESCSGVLKQLQNEMKKLLQIEEELSKCHKQFSMTISNISFKPIGSQTEDDIETENAFRKFGEVMDEIEDQRDRFISIKNNCAMKRLDRFRKNDIGRCKEAKRKFHSQTEKSCTSLEKSLGAKKNTKGIEELDTNCKEERENLFKNSLYYVDALHEVQELKRIEVCEALLQIMFAWKTFYHTGYEAFNEFESYSQDLSLRLQNLRDTFEHEKEEAEKLKERVSKKLTTGSTSSSPDTRQGYLYSKEKLAVGFGHSWLKYFCEYSRKHKTLTLRTYNQPQGRVGNTDQINVTNVVKKRTDDIPRRFCFEVTSADGKVWVLQALSEEDLKNWMEIMEGKEATYSEPMQAAKLRVPQEVGMEFVKKCIDRLGTLGLSEQGIYRVSGAQTKMSKLITNTFEDKHIDAVMEVDDVKVIASALKYYFREILPEPLLTFSLHEDFLEAMKTEDRQQKITNLSNVVSRLPKMNYECLKLLIKHLYDVAAFKDENLMQESNLGVVFGPTLMRPKEETVASIFNIKHQNILIENLIIEYDAIFEGGKMNEKYQTLVNSPNSSRLHRRPKTDKVAPRPPSQLSTVETDRIGNPFGSSDHESPSPEFNRHKHIRSHSSPHLYATTLRTSIYANTSSSQRMANPSPVLNRWPPDKSYQPSTPPQKPAKTLTRTNLGLGRTAEALYDCEAENSDELSFSAGDIITNIEDAEEDGWCTGSCRGHRGLVPMNFLKERNVSNI